MTILDAWEKIRPLVRESLETTGSRFFNAQTLPAAAPSIINDIDAAVREMAVADEVPSRNHG
jgi:hypothetical protein